MHVKKPRIEIRGRWFFIVADYTRQPTNRNIQKKTCMPQQNHRLREEK
jgi:hypothetical protein